MTGAPPQTARPLRLTGSKLLAETIRAHRSAILDTWVRALLVDPRFRQGLISREDLHEQCQRVVDGLLQLLPVESIEVEGPEFQALRGTLGQIASRWAHVGSTPVEAATFVLSLKDHVLPHLAAALAGQPEMLAAEATVLFKVLDTLSWDIIDAYVRQREEVISRQAREILDIATPVVQVWDRVLVAPIIGTLDSERTQGFMERLLNRIVETNSRIALVDITGVPAIDTKTAQHLIDTISAVRLLGAQVILTGVRPAIAQTLVHLGIDLSTVTTHASLSAGLQTALNALNLRVISRDGVA